MKDKEPNYDDIYKGLGNYNNENLSRKDILNEDDCISKGAAASIVTDEIAGVKKGNSMSIEDAVKGTNPNYDAFGNITYKVNCQACVAVAEARIRGYDLEVNIGLDSDIKRELGKRPNIAFIDPQTGINRDLEFLSRIQYKFDWKDEPFPPKILRVDDKKLNLKVMNQISKPSIKKIIFI